MSNCFLKDWFNFAGIFVPLIFYIDLIGAIWWMGIDFFSEIQLSTKRIIHSILFLTNLLVNDLVEFIDYF